MSGSSNLNDTLSAANEGDARAQCSLGVLYEEGDGVKKDFVRAVAWHRRSAGQGDAEAHARLSPI